ncbi:CLUMA_CG014951, isoform A [Clunio marinus]|uniref:CLUMA_CG014951, isoform A n=1 Tax=Clunio marinus TaxID=568069 RepID=A0A1J1INC5_9DIPT|nr:CLUMA_CG014951, isoform A [Clunio marinus]
MNKSFGFQMDLFSIHKIHKLLSDHRLQYDKTVIINFVSCFIAGILMLGELITLDDAKTKKKMTSIIQSNIIATNSINP